MRQFDVVVIGGGPAGASAALEMAKQGLQVLILEKEQVPRYKVCGGGLVFKGRKSLPMPIDTAIEREFREVSVYFDDLSRRFRTQRPDPIITMVMRDRFDQLLLAQAQQHGAVLETQQLLNLRNTNSQVILTTDHEEISAHFVVAADGALGKTARMAGWAQDTRRLVPALELEVAPSAADFDRLHVEARFDMEAAPAGYAWCFPKKNHLSIGISTFTSRKINLKLLVQNYLDHLNLQNPVDVVPHGFQIPISPRTDGFAQHRVFLVGDAAGLADPLTAEGISNALHSGKIAGETIAAAQGDPSLAEQQYTARIHTEMISELKYARRFAQLLYTPSSARRWVLKHYGQHCCERLTSVFMGEQPYPNISLSGFLSRLKQVKTQQ